MIIYRIKLNINKRVEMRKHKYVMKKLRVISVNFTKNQKIIMLLKTDIKKIILQFKNFIVDISLKFLKKKLKNISIINYEK